MNVAILSSSSDKIDDKYKSLARGISNLLASDGFDLVFGGSNYSMMDICYEEFEKKKRKIYAFTTSKYADQLKELKNAKYFIRDNTFDMKKSIFENSNLIVVLPGGIGTVSELFSFIEENRSGNDYVPIEIFDEDGYYKNFFLWIAKGVVDGVISDDIYNYFNVSHTTSEFKEHLCSYMSNEKGMNK